VGLGERRHELRVFGNKGRVYASLLQEVSDKLVNQAGDCARRAALDLVLLQLGLEEW
jgi:hypothetical protein